MAVSLEGKMDASVLFDRKARAVPVALRDFEVKATLRLMGEPICFFGELPSSRRLRLQRLCATQGLEKPPPLPSATAVTGTTRPQTEFLSLGSDSLHQLRSLVALRSIKAATHRLEGLRSEFVQGPDIQAVHARLNANVLRSLTLVKQVGNATVQRRPGAFNAPLSFTSVSSPSPHQPFFATGSDDQTVALWSSVTGDRIAVAVGHSLRVNHVDTALESDGSISIASCSNARDAKLWRVGTDSEGKSVLECKLHFQGHVARVSKVRFAPQRLPLMATSSHDGTVRLWDTATAVSVSSLDCCSRGARSVAFHPDGSLLIIADDAGHSFIMDIRTGRYLAVLESPNGPALDAAFSPSGVHVAVGGGDGTVRLFDLRSMASKGHAVDKNNVTSSVLTIAAHNDWITQVGFAPTVTGSLLANLVSASVDGTLATHDGLSGLRLSRTLGAMANFNEVPTPVRGFAFASSGEDEAMPDVISVAHEPYWRAWAMSTEDGVATARHFQVVNPAAAVVLASAATDPVVGDDAAVDAAEVEDDDEDDPFAALKRK